MNTIILASESEGRKELFTQTFGNHFQTYSCNIDEKSFSASTPKELVTLLAYQKTLATYPYFQDDCICAFDTMVECENTILGKPSNLEEAKKMLSFLNNKIQVVWTGYAFHYKDFHQKGAICAELILSMTEQQIDHYIQKYPVTKFAGAYAIQKEDANITIVSGKMDTIIGAPMTIVKEFVSSLTTIKDC